MAKPIPPPLTKRQLNEFFIFVKSAIVFATELCNDQSNGMTDGQICIAALKDIGRKIKDVENNSSS